VLALVGLGSATQDKQADSVDLSCSLVEDLHDCSSYSFSFGDVDWSTQPALLNWAYNWHICEGILIQNYYTAIGIVISHNIRLTYNELPYTPFWWRVRTGKDCMLAALPAWQGQLSWCLSGLNLNLERHKCTRKGSVWDLSEHMNLVGWV